VVTLSFTGRTYGQGTSGAQQKDNLCGPFWAARIHRGLLAGLKEKRR